MINMTQFLSNEVADNTISINGATFKVTDETASKILELCTGKVIVNEISSLSTKSTSTKTEYHSVGTKAFKPQFQIQEFTVNNQVVYAISRKNGWTRSEKSAMNAAIKALCGTSKVTRQGKKVDVSFTEATPDGKEFKIWCSTDKAYVESLMKKLPTTLEVEYFEK
mgnify:CR=1 FL=1